MMEIHQSLSENIITRFKIDELALLVYLYLISFFYLGLKKLLID